MTINGISGSLTASTTIALTVTAPPDFTLTVPSIAVSVAQGANGTSTATTAVSGGFSASIALTASGLPAGVYIGFQPEPLSPRRAPASSIVDHRRGGPAVATGNYSITVTGMGGSVTHTAAVALTVTSAAALPGTPLLVGYLPDYQGNYASFATSLDFNKMTHLVLAFALPPSCGGTCTASSNMTWSLNQTDADIATLVSAAHAAGVKVLLSIAAAATPRAMRGSKGSTKLGSRPSLSPRSTVISRLTTSTAWMWTSRIQPIWARTTTPSSPR